LRPDCHCDGVELSPLSWLFSKWRARGHASVDLRWGSFWQTSLAPYDVVYAYLSPVPMARLWRKARREMRPGTLLVSNQFAVPGVAPSRVLPVGGRRNTSLYVWRM